MTFDPTPVPDALSPYLAAAPPVVQLAGGTLRQVTGEGVPDGMYGTQCQTCGAYSDMVDDDPTPTCAWMIDHLRGHPTHQRFLATIHRHWRVDLPPGEPSSERAFLFPSTSAHASTILDAKRE